MSIKIIKAKITSKNTLEATYTVQTDQGTSNEITIIGGPLVHGDMLQAFDSLVPHFAKLCDTKEEVLFVNPSKLGDVVLTTLGVRSFSISEGNAAGVTLSGYRLIGTGKQTNFSTPFIRYEDDPDPYRWIDDLRAAIDACCSEVELYIVAEKYGAKQTELFDDQEGGETVTIESGGEKRKFKKRSKAKDDTTDIEHHHEEAA